jgi:hypothetical protein
MSQVALHLITLKVGEGGAKDQDLSDVGPGWIPTVSTRPNAEALNMPARTVLYMDDTAGVAYR